MALAAYQDLAGVPPDAERVLESVSELGANPLNHLRDVMAYAMHGVGL